jgi:hypothetical protein
MNKDRILALADLVERQPHSDYYADAGFNMETYIHKCGTPSCIAGWAIFTFGGRSDLDCASDRDTENRDAGELLGIGEEQSYALFQPLHLEIPLRKITPKQSAATLRHLAETGEVDWSIGGAA